MIDNDTLVRRFLIGCVIVAAVIIVLGASL